MPEDASLVLLLENGNKIPIAAGTCMECENEFFFRHHLEWKPNYCPYCGIKFVDWDGPLKPENP